MESLRDVGNVMGDYAGDGQGDVQATVSVGMESGDADAGVVYEQPVDLEEEVSTDAEPLLFLYDCETTGLSIYNDHITDIASKVIACPVPLLTPSFSSLVKTSKHISAPGMPHYNYSYTY